MATNITRSKVRGWKGQAERLKTRIRNMNKQSENIMSQAVHSTEVGGAAFLMGVIQGRKGSVELMGVPLELALALGLHGSAFMGLGGKMAPHLHGFADGCLGAYMTTLGRGVGVKMRKKAGSTASTKGELPGGGNASLPSPGTSLTDEDMYYARMANAI